MVCCLLAPVRGLLAKPWRATHRWRSAAPLQRAVRTLLTVGKASREAGVGAWRSLVAHLLGVQGVASSNLAVPILFPFAPRAIRLLRQGLLC
jgi:hypothetical protein